MSALLTVDVRNFACRSVLCWLATVDEKGQPHVSPKEVWTIMDEDTILVANIASPFSAKNIRRHSKVCLSFIDVFVQKGFKVLGDATELPPSAADFLTWAEPLYAMVGNRFQIRSVFVVRATEVHRIVAPSYAFYPAETTQESQIRAAMQTYGVQSNQS